MNTPTDKGWAEDTRFLSLFNSTRSNRIVRVYSFSMDSSAPHGRCWAEIDLSALLHNLAQVRELIPSGTVVAAVLKADAYGHGLARLATALRGRVELFAVANVMEAQALRSAVPGSSVMILGPALPEEREVIIRERFLPVVSSLEEARAYASALFDGEAPLEIHLAVDTGMGRIGVWEDDAVETARQIATLPGLRLTGAGTHLPSADEDEAWTLGQLARWHRVVAGLRAAGLRLPSIHSLNSAGTLLFGAVEEGSMVRPGLMLYGSSPVAEYQSRLRPVLAWKTRIALLRDVPAGRGVSYGRTFITPQPMRIATLAAGYGDGYPRHLSNAGAEVLIGGRRCPVLGRVTMDQLLVDVSQVPGVQTADEAVFIGRQGNEEILASELAARAGTIPWEIFTRLTGRVARVYL